MGYSLSAVAFFYCLEIQRKYIQCVVFLLIYHSMGGRLLTVEEGMKKTDNQKGRNKMKNYSISMMNGETIMVKTKEEIKDWTVRVNVTDKDGSKLDLRNAKSGMVIRANGKLLVLSTTLATPQTFYKNK